MGDWGVRVEGEWLRGEGGGWRRELRVEGVLAAKGI